MYRLQYKDNLGMPCCTWFKTHDDAMRKVDLWDIEQFKVRFIEFPFEVTRNSTGLSEDEFKLQWLNMYADIVDTNHR